MLSPDALAVLVQLFGPKSNVQLPAGWARLVIEIEQWAAAELEQQAKGAKP